MRPLQGLRILNLGINAPPNVACRRLAELGATVTKVEPPSGDPDAQAAPGWYRELTAGQSILHLDLKAAADRATLDELLAETDVLVTSSRPAALARLGLAWSELEARFPRLVQVAIVGHPAPRQHIAGHDLTYTAALGLVRPPALPRTLVADLGGAERAVSIALALVLGRESPGATRYAEVALADAAGFFALPLRHGITTAGGVLGGGHPFYGLYEAKEGWIAVAALEPHFQSRLYGELGLEPGSSAEAIATAFRTRTASEWETFAEDADLPIVAVVE